MIKIHFGHWLPKLLGVRGITLYPFILLSMETTQQYRVVLRHEMIHVSQIRAESSFRPWGWLKFYTKYLAWYFWFLVKLSLNDHKAYMSIPYEVYAYRNQWSPMTPEEQSELSLALSRVK